MIKDNLIEWMPEYYSGPNVNAIQNARDLELQAYKTSQNRVIADMYVSTAQDINFWENEYGVIGTGSLLQRQQSMLAIIRGGGGAVTREQIINLINSYTGTNETELTEYADQSIIRITCHLMPTSIFNLEEMETMLYALIQGHVGVIIDAVWSYSAESAFNMDFANKGNYTIAPLITT